MPAPLVDYNRDKHRLLVIFPYNPQAVDAVKGIAGRKFVDKHSGGPLWELPATLRAAKAVRQIFGDSLQLTEAAKEWGREEARKEANLLAVAGADDAELKNLPIENPRLFEFISGRTYQRADVSFLSQTSAINTLQPGLGKTVEIIAAIYEAKLIAGQHLVCAPVTSLRSVWEYEWKRFGADDVDIFVAQGPDRDKQIEAALNCPNAFVLITNPDTIRRKTGVLLGVDWTTFTIDEFHKSGLPNTKSVFFKAANQLKAIRRYCLSGTPIGGKPEKLWSALHFIDPKTYSSKWRWIYEWLKVEDARSSWGQKFGTVVGGIKPEKLDEFYEALRPVLVRRLKSDVAKDLPAKQYVDLWLPMEKEQAKQYKVFAEEAEIRIDEEHLSATSILAEYTRLKQFANAKCEIEPNFNGSGRPTLLPTFTSNKLAALLDKLAEHGIAPEGDEDGWGDQQAVVASQFSTMVRATAQFLETNGISVAVLTGDTKPKDRERLVREFQDGKGPRVVCLTTTAGGVAITLDRADSMHILDHTWVPDDQEQLEDRIHRISRVHNVTVYNYHSVGTIEQYIDQVNKDKENVNQTILQLRREGVRAI